MLSVLSYLYAKIMDARNALYDRGVFDAQDLGARVISIGNLTTGGTGKTPLVAYVARVLADRGEKVCILTRGYWRDNPKTRVLVSDGEHILNDPRQTGDEPLELARRLKGNAIVIADADRAAAGDWAKRRFGVTAFVLDDGFQHRKVKRDVDILCIDATQPFHDANPLPAGRLRESRASLARASAVVITRADLVDDATINELKDGIAKLNDGVPIFEVSNRLKNLKVKGRVYAFCGIGNPKSFFEMLKRADIDVAGTRTFADHHVYSQDDLNCLHNEAKACGASVLGTTAKDAVKLENLEIDMPLHIAEIELEIDDAAGFAQLF